uniref:Retrotransposon gag domain-containing protein n=1 Tax=Cuerna arida TaxID=1464854 RepID=A0A1B6GL44_9HEMI
MDITAPSSFSLDGNTFENWSRFKQKFNLYIKATDKSKKSGKQKVALLLCLLGDSCLDIYNNFDLADDNKYDYDKVLLCFDKYFKPKQNTVVDRYKFFNLRQNTNEPLDSFVTRLKTQAKVCNFGDQEESLVRDLLIIGIQDTSVKERLLIESDLKLDKAIQYCRAKEESSKHVKLMQDESINASHSEIVQDELAVNKIRKYYNAQKTTWKRKGFSTSADLQM